MDEGSHVLHWKYFLNSPGRGTALTQWFHLPSIPHLCHKERVRLKNSPVVCLWLLWAIPRFPRGTFSCVSAIIGTFLEELEKLLYQGHLCWYVGLYDWEISVCPAAPGKIQMVKGFEWTVGHALEQEIVWPTCGSILVYLFVSSLEWAVVFHLGGQGTGSGQSSWAGHYVGPVAGLHFFSVHYSVHSCLGLSLCFFSLFFGHVNFWIFVLVHLKSGRLEWCMDEISITHLPHKGIFILLKWSWINSNFFHPLVWHGSGGQL